MARDDDRAPLIGFKKEKKREKKVQPRSKFSEAMYKFFAAPEPKKANETPKKRGNEQNKKRTKPERAHREHKSRGGEQWTLQEDSEGSVNSEEQRQAVKKVIEWDLFEDNGESSMAVARCGDSDRDGDEDEDEVRSKDERGHRSGHHSHGHHSSNHHPSSHHSSSHHPSSHRSSSQHTSSHHKKSSHKGSSHHDKGKGRDMSSHNNDKPEGGFKHASSSAYKGKGKARENRRDGSEDNINGKSRAQNPFEDKQNEYSDDSESFVT